jgi:hypothetical protein
MVFHADRLHAQLYVGSGLTPGTLDRVVEIPESARDPEWEYDLLDDLRVNATPATLEAVKGVFSGLRVPIRLEGQVVAGLGFLSKTVGFFSQDDVLVARRVADLVALSLARERSIQASKRAEEATERASRLESRVQALTDELNARAGFHRVVGKSTTWRQALTQATQSPAPKRPCCCSANRAPARNWSHPLCRPQLRRPARATARIRAVRLRARRLHRRDERPRRQDRAGRRRRAVPRRGR